MKEKIKIFVISSFLLLFTHSIHAEVKLPAVISSNMVLQRNTTVALWGWADANEEITIKFSWLKENFNVKADEEGNWKILVKTTNSKEEQTIRFKSKTSNILLENILFGEVWLCSGQSNMYQYLKGYNGSPIYGSAMAVAKSNNSKLRLFTVENVGAKTPLKDVAKYISWQQSSPETVLDFSALAYFFGKQLQEILDVPVGLIHSSWGGSVIKAWMSKEVLESYQNVELEGVDITKDTRHISTALYNAKINPLIPFTIKGVIWYQGESDKDKPNEYKTLFPAMVKDWRKRWGIGDFPFIYVQIAPYLYDKNNKSFGTVANSAFMREAQLQCLDLIPNSGIVITLDIGDAHCIHPPKKKEVAERLVLNALNKAYGYENVDCESPIYDSFKINDGAIILKFKNAKVGLYNYGELKGFEIAGKDKVFYPAIAKIGNDKKRREVIVKSDKVPNPVAVRYAWRNWVVGTLYGNNLLPASSFRTDNWDDATLHKE